MLIIYSYPKNFFWQKNYKYFIGYTDEYKIKPFTIILPKMGTYVKCHKQTDAFFD